MKFQRFLNRIAAERININLLTLNVLMLMAIKLAQTQTPSLAWKLTFVCTTGLYVGSNIIAAIEQIN